MNKTRLEALSDGVFSIVMTLLIFDLKVPTIPEPITDMALWNAFGMLWPHILVYAGTFAVLSTMWVNHHFLFQSFAKEVDRRLNLMNLLYLMTIAFVPFTASFLGSYPGHAPAAILYGANLLLITFISVWMVAYIKKSQGLAHLSARLLNQSRFRLALSMICYFIGMVISYVNVLASVFFFTFPIIFNIIPGTLDFTEKLFRFSLGEDEE